MPEIEDHTLDGVTDETVQLTVSAGQYAKLEAERVMFGRPRITHQICVGPFYLPHQYVVVATSRDTLNGEPRHLVTLARLES